MVFEFTGSMKSRGELAAASPGSLPSSLRQIEIARLRDIERRTGGVPERMGRENVARLAELVRLERAGHVPERPAAVTPHELAVASGIAETQRREAELRLGTRRGAVSVFAGPGAGERLAQPSRFIPGEETFARPTGGRIYVGFDELPPGIPDKIKLSELRATHFEKGVVTVSESRVPIRARFKPAPPPQPIRETIETGILLPSEKIEVMEERVYVPGGGLAPKAVVGARVVAASAAMGIVYPILHPVETVKGFGYAVRHPILTVKLMKEEAIKRPLSFAGEFLGFMKGVGIIEKVAVKGIKVSRVSVRKIGGKEVPIEKVISPEVRAGEVLAEVRSVKEVMKKFEKGRLVEGGVRVLHAAEKAPDIKQISISPKAALKGEDIGLWISPVGEAMKWPLRFEGELHPRVITRPTLIPLKGAFKRSPAIAQLTIEGIERMPKAIVESPGWRAVHEFEVAQAGRGVGLITAKLERHITRRGIAETEAIVAPTETFKKVVHKPLVSKIKGFKEFVVIEGEVVKMPEWMAIRKGVDVPVTYFPEIRGKIVPVDVTMAIEIPKTILDPVKVIRFPKIKDKITPIETTELIELPVDLPDIPVKKIVPDLKIHKAKPSEISETISRDIANQNKKILKEMERGAKEFRELAGPRVEYVTPYPVVVGFRMAPRIPVRRVGISGVMRPRAAGRAELRRDVRPVRPVLDMPRAVDRKVARVAEPVLRLPRIRGVDRLRLPEPPRRGDPGIIEERIDTPKISVPKIPATKLIIPRLELEKRKKLEIKKKRKGPLFYVPGFTGRVVGVPELKLPRSEAVKLLKKTYSGLEIRPSVKVVGLKNN